MRENAADSSAQDNKYCEALCVIQEAERLRELTVQAFYGDMEVDHDLPSMSEADTDDDRAPAAQIECCAARVQSAARAVAEDARRLESETKRYAAQLLAEFGPICEDPQSANKIAKPGDSWYDQVLEALAVAREAERLQTLVVKMLARTVDPEGEGEKDNV